MDDMEQKLNSILGNPEMMAQLMSMAQSLGQSQSESPEQTPQTKNPPPAKVPTLPAGMDLNMLQKVAGLAQQSSIDRNQQALLKALSHYLSKDRLSKLEKAMRAAKIAGVASAAIGGSGSLFQLGR